MTTTTKKGYELIAFKPDKYGTPIALINRHTEITPYVVCWNYNNETDSWGQGHYFMELEDAMYYFNFNY